MLTDFYIKLRGEIKHYDRPVVMGILNATPDSFYGESCAMDADAIVQKVKQMQADGADIIDVGACSTRPGSELATAAEELERIAPAIAAIRSAAPDMPISVDTFRSEVAREAVALGADMINDVSGGNADPKMFETVAELRVPYVLTHMQGNPVDAHSHTQYADLMADIVSNIDRKVHRLNLLGVDDIIIDPGFGFSKDLEQNYQLMRNLQALRVWHLPILVGVSRKSMVTKLLDITAADALPGTVALNTCALWQGANILRVHDVAAAAQTIKIFNHSCPNRP